MMYKVIWYKLFLCFMLFSTAALADQPNRFIFGNSNAPSSNQNEGAHIGINFGLSKALTFNLAYEEYTCIDCDNPYTYVTNFGLSYFVDLDSYESTEIELSVTSSSFTVHFPDCISTCIPDATGSATLLGANVKKGFSDRFFANLGLIVAMPESGDPSTSRVIGLEYDFGDVNGFNMFVSNKSNEDSDSSRTTYGIEYVF